MASYRRFPFILAVSLISLIALACGPLSAATPTLDPNAVALAVQLTLQAEQAAGGAEGGASPTEPPAATQASPPTEIPAGPTPTVVHVIYPVGPAGTTSFMTDRSSAALAGERRSIADNFDVLLIERPFTANVMDYQGYLDITRGELSIGAPWVYVTIFLEAAPPAGSSAVYGVEVDIDVDGRGDFLIIGQAPASTEWTTDGVRLLRDTNNDIGGPHPIAADAPVSGTNGYDEVVFNQGYGPDPDAAWIRLDPAGSSKVQVAFKYAAIGSPDEWMWGVWADEGVHHPEWFDYNDHFTAAEAGSPTSGSSLYPVKAVASVDNSCRWAVGFTPDGDEPGVCYIPPTPTPVPQGSIEGRVTNLGGGFSGGTVLLGQGSCAASGFKSTSISSTGYYKFTGLAAGTYCVTVDTSSLSPVHTYGWDPYNPDFPVNADPYRTVALGNNEAKAGVNFHYVDVIG